MQKRYFGLWQFCAGGDYYGTYQCQSLSQFGIAQLAQYGIVGFRVLVILGCIFGTGGFFAGVASSDSVNIASTKKDKGRAAGGAAGMFSLAGVLILAATSWAANSIIKRWKQLQMGGGGMSINAGTQWTLGAAIYAGWIAAAIYIGVAIIMFMGCCQSSGDDEDEYEDDYRGAPAAYAESGYSQGRKEFV
ncbi:Oidioi.mRNA.OKI2018_I69.chr1.g747.t2.cds [Oikopleura dioica]|uniref:Claudin n=1 Tax=Oikopleura dioica TaxID=34765 RepID=A0ABN7SQT1_OIKDI|nr:Oidioi.mRNA.OKI2018_I69.chr1.g747.t2.cds [Oikopleura dioica]